MALPTGVNGVSVGVTAADIRLLVGYTARSTGRAALQTELTHCQQTFQARLCRTSYLPTIGYLVCSHRLAEPDATESVLTTREAMPAAVLAICGYAFTVTTTLDVQHCTRFAGVSHA